MWQNSPNLGERGDGEEASGGSAAGTNFGRDLWAGHPNLSSAQRQLRDLSSEGGEKKSHNSGSCTQLFTREGGEREGSGGGRTRRPRAPGARRGSSSCHRPRVSRSHALHFSPRQRKTHGKSRGMLPAASRERGEAVPAAPSPPRVPPAAGARGAAVPVHAVPGARGVLGKRGRLP